MYYEVKKEDIKKIVIRNEPIFIMDPESTWKIHSVYFNEYNILSVIFKKNVNINNKEK